MKKIILVSLILVLFTSYSFAQCDNNEVEIRVDIITDDYGLDTYWTLSNESGDIIMQGGQDGVYNDLANYSETLCIAKETCVVFEIYDEHGDGFRVDKAGYRLYIDNILASSGPRSDYKSYESFTTNCPCQLSEYLIDFQNHINGIATLNEQELLEIRDNIPEQPECMGNEAIILFIKTIIEDYDNLIGPLFSTPNTINGFSKDADAAPGLGAERMMVAIQQLVFDAVFSKEVYSKYPEHIDGWIFNSSNTFPGYVNSPTDPLVNNTTPIRANFSDPDGANPYFTFNEDDTAHALRPTGLYLAPGSIVSVTVPIGLVDKDYYVRVGSHEWDLGIRNVFKRLDRISKKFPIDSTTIDVFNPFGGAISILVPYGADQGIVEVSVTNGVESPFFSLKSFYETPDFDAELNKPGPWAIFETDNVMFTIPSHSIVPDQYDLRQAMLDWDKALQGVNSIMARDIVSDKHNMYMIADIEIRYPSFSVGYPMSNSLHNFTDVPGPAYFIIGVGPNEEVNFHESGHALAMTKFPGEEEALVQLPYIIAMNYGLKEDLNEAVRISMGGESNNLDIDKTATHRMMSNTFGEERDILNATTNEVRYQQRGYGHYFEIVNTLGWCPIRNFWRQEFIDTENGADYGGIEQDIDSRILRMSVAAQADLRPLFQVFGILPQDSAALQDSLNQSSILPSIQIYNRLQDYFNLIPEDNAAFVDYALLVYPELYTVGPNFNPDYGEGWFYQKSLTYDSAEAQQRLDILQDIIELYYPNGEPSNETPDVCCLLDTMNINIINEEVIVTGGVAPYDITIDINNTIQTVTVIDYDGCETIAEFAILGISEELMQGIKIYPNPALTEIYIDVTDSSRQIENLQMISINGQLVKQYQKDDRILDVTALIKGIYILRIELADGTQINKKVMVLR